MKTKLRKGIALAVEDESRIKPAEAEVIKTELFRIEARDGCLTPIAVVDSARPLAAPLHKHFTWDDEKAAELHRQEEARRIIRAVVIIREDAPERHIRAFVSVQGLDSDSPEGHAYVSTIRALEDQPLREQVLQRAKDDLASWRRRYEGFVEFSEIVNAIDNLAITE